MNAHEIRQEIGFALDRLGEVAVVDQKKELTQNLYPLLGIIAEHLEAKETHLTEIEAALSTLILQAESMIHLQLAKLIEAAISLGMMLADHADGREMPPNFSLPDTIRAMRMVGAQAMQAVSDVTVGDDDDDDDDDDDQEDENDDDLLEAEEGDE